MSADDIEASKAPLMEHLIELRSRLIKALLGFGLAFILCFVVFAEVVLFRPIQRHLDRSFGRV